MAGIYRLTSGGLMVNYRCQARCGHCFCLSSPEREDLYLTPETAAEVFSRVRALGAPSLYLTGGEPFLRPDALFAVLETAQKALMPMDYIETSSSWVESEAEVRSVLRQIRVLGVDTLSLSVSPYLNEYVPLEKGLLLARLCREEGLTVSVWTEEFLPDVSALSPDRPHARAEYEALFGAHYWAQLRSRHALKLVGRALLTHAEDVPTVPTARIPHMSRPCAELGERSHYHIDPCGNYIPPGCPGLALPLEALGRELDPEEYPVYTHLAQGPRALLEFCRARGFVPGTSYFNRCALCQQMRLFLYVRFPGVFRELAPASFYEALLRETGASGSTMQG